MSAATSNIARPAGKLFTEDLDLVPTMIHAASTTAISVHPLVEADILLVADTWWNGVYPFIDYSTGGSIDGQIRAAQQNVDAVTAGTIVVPGHGPIGNRESLIEFRDMLVAIREKVAGLKRQGMTVLEVIAAKPTAAFDAKWGQFLITPSAFTALVYQGV
jgi:glyoxylase-like metal-dependent hydrolase (beta-lactamase superfamily II)